MEVAPQNWERRDAVTNNRRSTKLAEVRREAEENEMEE